MSEHLAFGHSVQRVAFSFARQAYGKRALEGSGRISLSESPRWVISATWDIREENLLLVDVLTGSILVYNLAGHLDRTASFSSGARAAFIARQGNGGYVIKDGDTGVAWLGRTLGIERESNLRHEVGQNQFLEAVHAWIPSADNIFVFGDIKTSKPIPWESALVKINQEGACCVEYSFEQNDPACNFFLLENSMLATVGNKAYSLVMSGSPYLLEIGFGSRRLRAVPPGFGRPRLPEAIDRDNIAAAYEAIANSKSAAGVIGWRDRLFVLTRQPLEGRSIKWQLWEIDASADKIVGTPIVLPTRARHIIVVPGERRFAIVEKGDVKGPGDQEIEGVVFFPVKDLKPGSIKKAITWDSKLRSMPLQSLTAR